MTTVEVDDTYIEVGLPLPVDVVATITRVFGTVWKDAVIDLTGQHGRGLVIKIPHDSRCRTKAAAKKIRAAKTYLESEIEAQVRGFDKDGSLRADATAYIGRTIGAAARAAFEDNDLAVNYLEMQVSDPVTGKRYVITAAKSAPQLPAALHSEAKQRIAELEAELTQLRGSSVTKDGDS